MPLHRSRMVPHCGRTRSGSNPMLRPQRRPEHRYGDDDVRGLCAVTVLKSTRRLRLVPSPRVIQLVAANALDSAKSDFPYAGRRSYDNRCSRDTLGSCFGALAPKSYSSLTMRMTAHLTWDGLHLIVHSRCMNMKILLVKLGLFSLSSPSQLSPKPSPRRLYSSTCIAPAPADL